MRCIFKLGSISESLKMGLLTPVFKNKGRRQQAINYRGITVLPVIGKSWKLSSNAERIIRYLKHNIRDKEVS